MRRIGVTLGEPCGIGPELVVRCLAKGLPDNAQFTIYGSPRCLESTARMLDIAPFWEVSASEAPPPTSRVLLRPTGPDPESGFSMQRKEERARAALTAVDQAAADCQSGRLDVLLTAPLDKAVVRAIAPDFCGHTEYLGEKAGVRKTVMLLDNTEIRVVLLTQHVPLREVPERVTPELVEITLQTAANGLREWFGIEKPRIAVAGLNPHAGEIVPNSEEEAVLRPVIEKLAASGWSIEGPLPADSLFPLARDGRWDLLVSPYHDQGLVAVKYPGVEKVVNITLGLPYLRVSPGHGVAYDQARKGQADTRSFQRALRIAVSGRLKEL